MQRTYKAVFFTIRNMSTRNQRTQADAHWTISKESDELRMDSA